MTDPTTSPTDTVPCPTCNRPFLRVNAVRCHHTQTHNVSLTGVDPDDWGEYVRRHRADIENPDGRTVREESRAERHPAYTTPDE